MGIQDADFVQCVLECNKAVNAGKPQPEQQTQRRVLLNRDLMIQDGWKEMSREHQKEWMNASDTVKEKILAQQQSQSSGSPTKNHQLPTNGRSV